MDKTTLYHGSPTIVKEPIIKATRFYKDFGWGFYCTNIKKQAIRWAIDKNSNRFNNSDIPTTGILNTYEYIENAALNICKFENMTDEWLDFISKCRNGYQHEYDIVEGAMADDQIWDWVSDYLDGRINRKSFWDLVAFKYPTHQISFHTPRALQCLKFKEYKEVSKDDIK